MTGKIGVLLSGCGVYDGSEIHEAVLTLLFIDKAGAKAVCMAPDMKQKQVINHYTQKVSDETRNVLVEAARIARGEIKNLSTVNTEELDALILPGGLGAAINLSNFAEKGSEAQVHPEVEKILKEMISAGKPIGAICIAPATVTKALAGKKPEVTIGQDPGTAENIAKMGGVHKECTVDMIHVDRNHKIVSTPAYMIGPGIKDIAVGIEKLVNEIVSMIS